MKLYRILLIAVLLSFLAVAAVSAEDGSDDSIYVRINTYPCEVDFEDNAAVAELRDRLDGANITLLLKDKGDFAKSDRFLFLMPEEKEYINVTPGDLVLDGDELLLICEPHEGNYTRLGRLHNDDPDYLQSLLDDNTSITFSLDPFQVV